VVATIKSEGASKSGHLAEALTAGKKIIVCTIQTLSFALEEVRKLAATEGKRFAVIADEAHSSQTGEAAAKLKQVLITRETAELGDGGELSTEDMLAAQKLIHSHCHQRNRLAANKHNSTDPDVTAVTVILMRLPTAVESIEIGRSARRDFGFRFFFAAMVVLLGGSGCGAA
jgi:SWI2/SNF2 ATPase